MLLHQLTATWSASLAALVVASPAGNSYGGSAPLLVPELPGSHVRHEQHHDRWAEQWSRQNRVSAEVILPVRIGLRQPEARLLAGHDLLMEISDPSSPKYGKHMTAEEVIDFFAPPKTSIEAIVEWLVDAGLELDRISHSTNKQWIQFDATTEEVEDLLLTEYYFWEHASTGSTDISCEAYYVPGHIQEHIDYVTPGVRLRYRTPKISVGDAFDDIGLRTRGVRHGLFPSVRSQLMELPTLPAMNSTSCDLYINAACIRAQYGIPNGTTAYPGNELGIFETEDDHYSQHDLDAYWSQVYPTIPEGTYPEERLVDGAVGAAEEPSDPPALVGAESSLDFESSWPLIWPQRAVLFQQDDQYVENNQSSDANSPYLGFLNTFLDAIDGSYCTYSAYGETGDCDVPACLDASYPDPNEPGGYKGQLQCGVYRPTNVISMSYAFGEQWLPAYYQRRQCNEFMKLALQGVTLVESSGDAGVGITSECPGDHGQIFEPFTANGCPYILSVGSTELDAWPSKGNCTLPTPPWAKLNEIPTSRFGSGGGFSNIYPRPAYQQQAVQAYFDSVELPFSGYNGFVDQNFTNVTRGIYNRGGRGYPDVAAVGDRFVMRWNESWWTVGGTSLSAPVWGAVITLVNEARLAAGKSTVGFVHPVLYAHPEVFNDITAGNNPGCNSTGFPAAPGWDPVTGLGSPNFPKLLDLLLKL